MENKISIFVNANELVFSTELFVDKIEILDLSGRNVATTVGARLIAPLQGGVQTINVSELPAGVYFLKITIDNQIITKKFVKE